MLSWAIPSAPARGQLQDVATGNAHERSPKVVALRRAEGGADNIDVSRMCARHRLIHHLSLAAGRHVPAGGSPPRLQQVDSRVEGDVAFGAWPTSVETAQSGRPRT